MHADRAAELADRYPFLEVPYPPDEREFVEELLSPGDVLFFPAGTWHQTELIDLSLSLTMTCIPKTTADVVEAFVTSIGFGMLMPNVRGSTGYGREFQMLDNYTLRWNSVKDGVDAAEWLVKSGYASCARGPLRELAPRHRTSRPTGRSVAGGPAHARTSSWSRSRSRRAGDAPDTWSISSPSPARRPASRTPAGERWPCVQAARAVAGACTW
jgi:hypothetical protein